MIPDFTVVLGIDQKTIEYLRLVWPLWRKHKPSLLNRQFLIFINGVTREQVLDILYSPEDLVEEARRIGFVEWPPPGVQYIRENPTKWTQPQRAMMLAGFVHVPAVHVRTPYWFKIDVDSFPTGQDRWIDPEWFDGFPSIIAPGWNYTKPADQMLRLDDWVARHKEHPTMNLFRGTEPLNLRPNPDSDLVRHPRIASWCSFYSTAFSQICSRAAEETCGPGQLPVDSQDGFMFYVAKRAGFTIRTVNMKRYGWQNRSGLNSVKQAIEELPQ